MAVLKIKDSNGNWQTIPVFGGGEGGGTSDGLSSAQITPVMPISAGELVAFGVHVVDIETEEDVFGYMPLRECHMIYTLAPILGATADIAAEETSSNVSLSGKFSIADIENVPLQVGMPVFFRCVNGMEALTVNGVKLMFDVYAQFYPELFEGLEYVPSNRLTQGPIGTYDELEESIIEARKFIQLGQAVSETEVLLSPYNPEFYETDLEFLSSSDAAICDSLGRTIADTYATKSEVGGTGKYVPISGSRGSLAGYETIGSNSYINATTSDANQVGSNINVANGSESTSWTKIVRVTSAVTVSLGSAWQWQGGEVPTIVSGGILVLCWCGSGGVASFISPM